MCTTEFVLTEWKPFRIHGFSKESSKLFFLFVSSWALTFNNREERACYRVDTLENRPSNKDKLKQMTLKVHENLMTHNFRRLENNNFIVKMKLNFLFYSSIL